MVKESAVYRFVDNMPVRMESAKGLCVDYAEQELIGVDALRWW